MSFARRVPLAALVAAALTASTLAAQSKDTSQERTGLGFGLQGGIGFSPGQFVLGAQYSLGKGLGIFRVVPNAHVGFGEWTSLDFNVDFLARVIAKDAGFGFYAGAAPTFWGDSEDSGLSLTVVAGTQVPLVKNHATNLEARIATGGAPQVRILLAYIF